MGKFFDEFPELFVVMRFLRWFGCFGSDDEMESRRCGERLVWSCLNGFGFDFSVQVPLRGVVGDGVVPEGGVDGVQVGLILVYPEGENVACERLGFHGCGDGHECGSRRFEFPSILRVGEGGRGFGTQLDDLPAMCVNGLLCLKDADGDGFRHVEVVYEGADPEVFLMGAIEEE